LKWGAVRGYTKRMKLRRALALAVTAVLLVPFARRAAAEDPRDAAAAAIAAAAGAAPKTEAPRAETPKPAAPKKKSGKTKKTSAKGRKKPEAESKYKTRALSENSDSHYRFDENGNPIVGAAKKTPAAKAKKKSSEDSEDKPACNDDAPCSDKKSSDADAL